MKIIETYFVVYSCGWGQFNTWVYLLENGHYLFKKPCPVMGAPALTYDWTIISKKEAEEHFANTQQYIKNKCHYFEQSQK